MVQHRHLTAVKCQCYRFPRRKTQRVFNIQMSVTFISVYILQLSGQAEYILSYFLHGSILCLGIYMSVRKPSICCLKRIISAEWRNKLLIDNINLTVIGRVHVVYDSCFSQRHESSLYFGIGGPRIFPRVVATMISKHFVNLGTIIYLRILQKI